MFTRRSFLATSVSALGGLAFVANGLRADARAQTGAIRRLVVIELRGGLDGLAALQPSGDARLQRMRPTLARPNSQLLGIADDCGLHPRLGRMAALFREGKLGIWRGVGHDKPNLSHFESRDYWDEGRVRAGLFGTPADLGRLDATGNLYAGVDFRCLYAGVLSQWLGADAQRVLGPGFGPEEVVRA